MPEEPLHIVVAAVCLRDAEGRLLSVRKRGTQAFMLPGGKLEAGETPAQAAAREAREEVGVEVADLALLGEFVSAAANEPGAVLTSTVFTATAATAPVVDGEIEELRWLDLAALPDDVPVAPMLRHHVAPALLARDAADVDRL
ncbi:NUDIX hydrolase [Nocardioides sp. CPCC 205120]|uniref:NUDIX hydrolase n=1 Tax=Nocardioides sp. CPCC 205120 TaxID=3406462 RepID=UPI003B502B2B